MRKQKIPHLYYLLKKNIYQFWGNFRPFLMENLKLIELGNEL